MRSITKSGGVVNRIFCAAPRDGVAPEPDRRCRPRAALHEYAVDTEPVEFFLTRP